MLEQLFGSKTRTKLLKIFLLNPNDAYFIRELTRKIDTQINSVRRELDNLLECNIVEVVLGNDATALENAATRIANEDEGLNKKIDKQPKKFFRLNKDFVLYMELKNLFLKSPLMYQNDFVKELKTFETIDFAILTGFFAERSDVSVDLLIVGEVPKQKFGKIIAHFEKELEREINYTTMTTEEFLYRKSLADMFLFKVLEGKKIVIIDKLQLRRERAAEMGH